MIKVSVMYPNTPGARFDHTYYRDKHMPLVQRLMGRKLQALHGGQGSCGRRSGTSPTYVGMCHLFCDSVESFQAGFGPHAQEIMADIPNYTDLDARAADQRSSRRLKLNACGLDLAGRSQQRLE